MLEALEDANSELQALDEGAMKRLAEAYFENSHRITQTIDKNCLIAEPEGTSGVNERNGFSFIALL